MNALNLQMVHPLYLWMYGSKWNLLRWWFATMRENRYCTCMIQKVIKDVSCFLLIWPLIIEIWSDVLFIGILQIIPNTTLVKGNYGDEGYYRVNYDSESWKAIAEQLRDNHTVVYPCLCWMITNIGSCQQILTTAY